VRLLCYVCVYSEVSTYWSAEADEPHVPHFVSAALTGRSHSAPHLAINISLAFTACVSGAEAVPDLHHICDECVIVWSTLGLCNKAFRRQETGSAVFGLVRFALRPLYFHRFGIRMRETKDGVRMCKGWKVPRIKSWSCSP